MSDPAVRLDTEATVLFESQQNDGAVTVEPHPSEEQTILLEVSSAWGAVGARLDPEDARTIGTGLVQTAERLETASEDEP